MLNSFLWGLLATSSLILGGIIATRLSIGKRTLGVIMASGAGTLISAGSYELVFEAVRLAKGTGFPAFGLFAGAFTFYFSDMLIQNLGARKHADIDASHQSSLVIPMVLAIILDGVPESIVIGLGIFEGGGTVSLAMLVAVLSRMYPAPAGKEPDLFFISTYEAIRKSARYSLEWILIAGVPRVIFYMQFEWPSMAGDLQGIAIVVKHIVMFLLVGTGLFYWFRLEKRVKSLKMKHGLA